MHSARRLLLSALVTLGVVACSLSADLRDLLAVQSALSDRFGLAFSVRLDNGAHLRIDVLDAGDAVRLGKEAPSLLEAIARTAYATYPRRDSLTSLEIRFTEQSGTPMLSRTTSHPGRTWSRAELRGLREAPPGGTDGGGPRSP